MESIRAVPWADPEVSLNEKVDGFFPIMSEIRDDATLTANMRVFFFANAIFVLLSLFFSTKTHPRVALLVSTVQDCYDDLFHFMLLWCVVYLSFGFLATVIFGTHHDSFGNISETMFSTQFDMMIGGLEYV